MTGLKKKTVGRTELAIFCLCLLLGSLALHYITGRGADLSNEAGIRAGVGDDLLLGRSRGRQGLIGSLYYAPLPTLLALPLLQLPAPLGGEGSFAVLALIGAALLATALSAWLRQCGVAALTRIALALCVLASPFSLRSILQGSGDMLFAFLIFTAFCLFIHWWRTESLRSLAYLAVVTGLAILTRFQAAALLVLLFLCVLLHLRQRSRGRSYAEATIIIFLAPALYFAGLWITANWLIIGKPFFFLRGLSHAAAAGDHPLSLLTDGCSWTAPLLLCLLALLAQLSALITGPRLRHAAGIGLLLASLLFWRHGQPPVTRQPSPADIELQQVLAEFNQSHRDDWLVVSGYRGYLIRRRMPAAATPHLYHSLNFYPDQMLKDTRGKRAYLLVPEPRGADRWEDINLKYPLIYSRPNAFTVYEKVWKHWVLWRIIRMDETDRK